MVRQEVAQALKVSGCAGAHRDRGFRRRVRRQAAGRVRGRGGTPVAARRRSRARGLDAGRGVHLRATRARPACSRSRAAWTRRGGSPRCASPTTTAARPASRRRTRSRTTGSASIARRAVVRQGSYRSLAAVANNFARESHMDEWAEELRDRSGRVPAEAHHGPTAARGHRADRGAVRLGQGPQRQRPRRRHELQPREGRATRALRGGRGLSRDRRVRVVRMVATGDFGAALNPGALQNQMTGGLIQGIGGRCGNG